MKSHSKRKRSSDKWPRQHSILSNSDLLLPDSLQADIKNLISTFLVSLSRSISISQVILFGSLINGRAHRWSDIDLCIISPDFRRLSMIRRRNMLLEVVLKARTPEIQAIGFTERELDKSKNPIILDEIRKGKRLIKLTKE